MEKKRLLLTDDQVEYLASVGYRLYEQGKIDDARTIFQGLIAANDSYYGCAGLGAIALGQRPPLLEEAYANLTKAAELNPNDATVQANIGEMLLRQAKFEEAAPAFRKALDLDPEKKDRGANRARAMIGTLGYLASEVQKTAVNA
jgi:tetratricopeptide (TPR) repeat protein